MRFKRNNAKERAFPHGNYAVFVYSSTKCFHQFFIFYMETDTAESNWLLNGVMSSHPSYLGGYDFFTSILNVSWLKLIDLSRTLFALSQSKINHFIKINRNDVDECWRTKNFVYWKFACASLGFPRNQINEWLSPWQYFNQWTCH